MSCGQNIDKKYQRFGGGAGCTFTASSKDVFVLRLEKIYTSFERIMSVLYLVQIKLLTKEGGGGDLNKLSTSSPVTFKISGGNRGPNLTLTLTLTLTQTRTLHTPADCKVPVHG